jgi:hypothetical protein
MVFNINIVQNIVNRPPPKSPDKIQHFICPAFVGRAGNQLFLFASSYGLNIRVGMGSLIKRNDRPGLLVIKTATATTAAMIIIKPEIKKETHNYKESE